MSSPSSPSSSFSSIPISSIQINREERQRTKISTEGLKDSIAEIGLINPIVVNKCGTLIAGERRLESCRELGWTHIPVKFVENLSEFELQLIELEENVKRSQLDWKEHALTVSRLHELLLSSNGASWSIAETSVRLSESRKTIERALRVVKAWDNPLIQSATSLKEAYNVLVRKSARTDGEALEDIVKQFAPEDPPKTRQEELEDLAGEPVQIPPRPVQPTHDPSLPAIPVPIHQGDFCRWAKQYDGRRFNLLHCDFPYGVGMFAGRNGGNDRAYEDTPEVYFQLLNALLDNMNRLVAPSAHLIFWYSAKFEQETRKLFAEKAKSWYIHPHPLVWFKSCNSGILGDSQRHPRHVYETALFGIRQGRPLVKTAADCFASPIDRRLHPSTKPSPVLKHFLGMLVDDSTRLLDPTCGSGGALRVAHQLGAEEVFGLEIDGEHCRTASRAWKEEIGR